MNVIKLRTRARALLGALAILLIGASLPAGAGVLPDEAKKVDEIIDLYDEEKREDATRGRGLGWSTASLDIARISLENLAGRGDVLAKTGDVSTTVNTVSPQPAAELMFNPHESFNDAVKPWNPKRRGLDSDAEQGIYRAILRHPAVPDVEGLLGIGRYYVRSNRMGSYAELGSASGYMRAKTFGLVSDMGDKGLSSAVTREYAKATVGATIEDFQINLNDVFQQERVELPLGLTLNIATAAALPGGETAQQAYARLKHFEEQMGVLVALAEEMSALQEELAPYLAATPGYDKAEQRLEAAEAALWQAKEDAKTAAETHLEALARNDELNSRIATVNAVLAALGKDIATLQKHIDDLKAAVEAEKAKVDALRAEEEELKKLDPGAGSLIGVASADRPRRVSRMPFGARMRVQRTLVDVAEELTEAVARLDALQQDLVEAETAKAVMQAASVDSAGELQDLETDKQAADAAVEAAQAARDAADADVEDLDGEYVDAKAAVDELRAAAAQLDGTASRTLARLQERKVDANATVFKVRSLAADLAALVPIYQKLTDTLQPWPLFKIKAISYELLTKLSDTETIAKTRCGVEGVELLGEQLEVKTCDDLRGLKPFIEEELEKFLGTFTLERPEVTLTVPEGIVMETPVAGARKRVETQLTPLQLQVEPFQVKTLTDPLMAGINQRIDTLQEQVSYDEIRDLVRLQDVPRPSIDWVLDWDPGEEWRVPASMGDRRMEMHAAGTAGRVGEPRYRATAQDGGRVDETEQDLDEDLDEMQETGSQTGGNTVGGQGTSGVHASAGGLDTDVMWAGCANCDGHPPVCDPVTDPTCDPDICTDPTCDDSCEAGDEDCPEECTSETPCTIGDPCLDDVPGCVDGRWRGVPRDGGDVSADAGGDVDGRDGDGKDGGNGVDGVPVGDIVGDADLPTTGGRPATLLLGLMLLLGAAVLRRPSPTS